jgi:hypothetical protein
MRFLCLAYESEQQLNDLSQEAWHALRRETLDYVESLRRDGILLETRALQSASSAKTVRVREGEMRLTDGPFAEAKEHIGGFFLIEAEDFDHALRIAAGWPSARIGSIEVRPIEDELAKDRRYR